MDLMRGTDTAVEGSKTPAQEIPQDNDDNSETSDPPEMEPFEDYKIKLEGLLSDIGFPQCSIRSIQHGFEYQNCVYSLTSLENPDEQFIIRVPGQGSFDENTDTTCPDIETGVCILKFLGDKLLVPQVEAFSATPKNSLGRPYVIHTRLTGESLNHVYGDLTWSEKRAIADQYIGIVAKLESIRFEAAGSLIAPSTVSEAPDGQAGVLAPTVQVFDGYDANPIQDPEILADRAGSDVKALYKSLIAKFVNAELQTELDRYNSHTLPYWRKMEIVVEEMDQEGFFKDKSEPIVMHHWDLEDRNIMVAQVDGKWKITGVLDWDEAICLPRPLARKPPVWLWFWMASSEEHSDGEYDCDQHPDRELSAEGSALKAFFDRRIEEVLPGYHEDAYGSGRWLRRLWVFIKDGLSSAWLIGPCEQLLVEWEARPKFSTAESEQHGPQEVEAEESTTVDSQAKRTLLAKLRESWEAVIEWAGQQLRALRT